MKTQSEAQPVAVIEATDKAALLTEIKELKEILRQILAILKEGDENVRPDGYH
jgi:hypothetical protein